MAAQVVDAALLCRRKIFRQYYHLSYAERQRIWFGRGRASKTAIKHPLCNIAATSILIVVKRPTMRQGQGERPATVIGRASVRTVVAAAPTKGGMLALAEGGNEGGKER